MKTISKKVVIYVEKDEVVDIVMKHYGLQDKRDIWGSWHDKYGTTPAQLTIRYCEDEQVNDD